jgi:hypothetical protein
VVTLTAELCCGTVAGHLLQNTCSAAAWHTNARPHTCNCICVLLHCYGWGSYGPSPCSPELPSVFHLLGPLKKHLVGKWHWHEACCHVLLTDTWQAYLLCWDTSIDVTVGLMTVWGLMFTICTTHVLCWWQKRTLSVRVFVCLISEFLCAVLIVISKNCLF